MQGDLSPSELAILELFASRMNMKRRSSPVLEYRELTSLKPEARSEMMTAGNALAERGWLCRGGHFAKTDNDPCILIAGGLAIARCLADMRIELR